MVKFIKAKLTAQVLLVLAGILIVSFVTLCVTILSRQGSLLEGMSEKIHSQLQETSRTANKDFTQLAKNVESSLNEMGEQVSVNLLASTDEALSTEESNITSAMEKLLNASARGVASLIASVGSDAIMAKDYEQLTELSRAGAKTEEILFILFLGKDDEPLPSYLNLIDDVIVAYLEDFEVNETSDLEEDSQQILRILNKAKSDSSVLVYESPIEYYGLKVGTIVIGVTRAGVIQEIKAMAGRFGDLKQKNQDSIQTVVANQSHRVVQQIEDQLSQVQNNNINSLENTAKLLKSSAAEVKASTTNVVLFVGTLSCLAILVLFAFLLKLMVINPIQRISTGLQDAAEGEGDLTKRLNSLRNDEIGVLAGWFDAFVERLNNIIVEIGGNSETVTSSSLEVLSASESLKSEAGDLSMKADSVAAASEEMNSSMTSVAAASEQAATNISLVAATAIEMKEALEEVVDSCDKATTTSRNATDQVRSATDRVSLLGEAAREISKVTEVITEIADQTNLLALNATIEAARAGEAGKGFSVVAGEIKSLATQTTDATREIKEKIEGIQNSTDGTVEEVGRINQVIGEVDAIIGSIAQSMTAQAGRASEVALNIEQASQGIGEVNENVAQSSQVSAEIAQDIGEVSVIAQEMTKRSDKMRTSSESLSELSSQLRNMISVFKVQAPQNESTAATGEETAGELVPWSKQLSLDLPEIDGQHKKLVSLINQLHNAMKSKAGAGVAGKILDELVDYTATHFAYEEKLFAEHGYPGRDKHSQEHTKLVEQVTDFQNQFKEGRAGLSMDLMYFLADWLKSHIMKSDKAYAPFLQSKMEKVH